MTELTDSKGELPVRGSVDLPAFTRHWDYHPEAPPTWTLDVAVGHEFRLAIGSEPAEVVTVSEWLTRNDRLYVVVHQGGRSFALVPQRSTGWYLEGGSTTSVIAGEPVWVYPVDASGDVGALLSLGGVWPPGEPS